MKITRQNYEAFFIDYLEGTLDEKRVNQFIEFLQKNPDLKEELSLFEPISLIPENTSFASKDTLYKDKFDVESEFNTAAIAQLEGDISPSEAKNFEAYLAAHPEKQASAKQFRKTILTADPTLTFQHKNKLYRKPAGRIVFFWAGRIAAVLVLAFAIFSLLDKNAETETPAKQFVQLETPAEKPEPRQNKVTPEVRTVENTPESAPKPATIVSAKPEKIAVREEKKAATINTAPKPNKLSSKTEFAELAQANIPVEVPKKMNRLLASMETPQPVADLAPISLKYIKIVIEQPAADERLLADVVKEKTGINKLSFNQIKKAGLNIVSNFAKDNLKYETDNTGKITEINYDSRLLAFSIPTGGKQTSE